MTRCCETRHYNYIKVCEISSISFLGKLNLCFFAEPWNFFIYNSCITILISNYFYFYFLAFIVLLCFNIMRSSIILENHFYTNYQLRHQRHLIWILRGLTGAHSVPDNHESYTTVATRSPTVWIWWNKQLPHQFYPLKVHTHGDINV